ncbi:cobalt-precorrin-6A reductase [Sinorhizobium americanum]|uniref:Precorrin-6A reductase CobK n=1 Tax=Sinorhizobium americanum TaxID=194963 RepID=A0A1L3LR98_9HYPH|nr:cobalt-precorrin-6A reductase [Sinorhizobium americanum]APG85953.1 precorrin-6A reductase CobK [Sinorhizobium americanum CCGM7]APG92611.1 precorrin-6A reductase CobK [Sinorhizobium americanum]OAP35510.1 cobalt-precorrin-6A/precorrin-6x reductase [Sinorhizobium americanum]
MAEPLFDMSATGRPRILILGGTTEARQLGERLAADPRYDAAISLAGRTADPRPQPLPTRVGGFGGAEGLAVFLREENICLLVDATHPFAARISHNAATAAAATGKPLFALRRPAWEAQPGDRWTRVASVAEAVSALGAAPRRVFLAIGRQEAFHFEKAPQHSYLVRSVDPVTPPLNLPDATAILAHGPFAEADELDLLRQQEIDVIVAKNSGGTATYGKIAAARKLGLEVVMVERHKPADAPTVSTCDEALERIHQFLSPVKDRGV